MDSLHKNAKPSRKTASPSYIINIYNMSVATSIRGKSFESSFKIGFLHKNKSVMDGGQFHSITGTTVYRSPDPRTQKMQKIAAGDIDAAFINSEAVKIVDLLPMGSCLRDREYEIAANSLIFFELTTTEGVNLSSSANNYIEKKIIFHKELEKGSFDLKPFPEQYVLAFCYNGADHVGVNKKFNGLCEEHQVTGVSVYLPLSAVEQWDATLTTEEKKLIAEEYARKAEENARKAEENALRADKHAAKAKKHKATADSRLLSLVKLLKLQNAPDNTWEEISRRRLQR